MSSSMGKIIPYIMDKKLSMVWMEYIYIYMLTFVGWYSDTTWPYQWILIWLVVDLPLWKMMEFVNGKDDIPFLLWKLIQMFETTNQ